MITFRRLESAELTRLREIDRSERRIRTGYQQVGCEAVTLDVNWDDADRSSLTARRSALGTKGGSSGSRSTAPGSGRPWDSRQCST